MIKGSKHTLESIEKMCRAKTGENNPWYGKIGKRHSMFGHKHTDETKQKMSKSRTGKKIICLERSTLKQQN